MSVATLAFVIGAVIGMTFGLAVMGCIAVEIFTRGG